MSESSDGRLGKVKFDVDAVKKLMDEPTVDVYGLKSGTYKLTGSFRVGLEEEHAAILRNGRFVVNTRPYRKLTSHMRRVCKKYWQR